MEPLYICPICADFFEQKDVVHCLACDHHYPPDRGNRCHNCGARLERVGQMCRTKVRPEDLDKLLNWDRTHDRARGVWELYLPDGRHYEGGRLVTMHRHLAPLATPEG